MPPRISRSSVPNSRPRNKESAGRNPKKSQKRSLDAFSIASHTHSDRPRLRQHRLGESDLSSHRKRTRENEDEDIDSEDGEDGRKRKKRVEKDRFDELSADEGSDSEGNEWKMGQVDNDDDESLNSDEAFGESDDERFEGWAFGGSSSNKKGKAKHKFKEADYEERDISLDEEEEESGGEEGDDDSLGDDAIDLATALDQWEESEEEKSKKKKKNAVEEEDDSDEPSEEDMFGGNGASDFSVSDAEEDDDPSKMAQLKNLIYSLPNEEDAGLRAPRQIDAHEESTPNEFGVLSKVDITSFKPKTLDPQKKKAYKLLQDDGKSSSRNDISRKLDAPLPKRQQDKLDRAAANTKTNETLERWVDTVKQNRRAEHISFPLRHPNAGESMGESRLLPTTTATPANDLESTIQSILQESGLSSKNGKDNEDQMQKWEELQTNTLPLEEVQARRVELRKQREFLFREEVRAKRIKKIKSKAYRRVHRKERERIAQRERDALKADGIDVSEDEREYNDRRRAEERMGAKHRDSKWAKGVKQSGKALWDDDARAGVTEMARRNEELRRRIEGKTIHDEDEHQSDLSSEEDGNEAGYSDEDSEKQGLQHQLGRLRENPFSINQDTSKLGGMLFMQRAEAARKARNDEDIERMRRELAGEESNSDEENDNATKMGRRKFGPSAKVAVPAFQQRHNEFEEEPGSDNEPHGDDDRDVILGNTTSGSFNTDRRADAAKSKNSQKNVAKKDNIGATNPYLAQALKGKKMKPAISDIEPANPYLQPSQAKNESTKDSIQGNSDGLHLSKKPNKHKQAGRSPDERLEPVISAPDVDGWQTVTYNHNDSDDDDGTDIEDEGIDLDVVLRNQSFTAKAFAGDNVEADFAAEKKAVVEDEDDKIVDNTLPGWGSWTGEGLSKRAQAKNKGKHLTKVEGIKATNRKDAKLDRVIINEKRVKKNSKYMATSLPFPFETKEQYERSLRLPKGPEWTTKQTFQNGTKPRVLVKQGIIRPMSKPLV